MYKDVYIGIQLTHVYQCMYMFIWLCLFVALSAARSFGDDNGICAIAVSRRVAYTYRGMPNKRMLVCMHVRMHACMYAYTGREGCTHVHTYACMYACVYIYICMHMHACMHVRMYVCMYVSMYTELIHETIRDNTCVCVCILNTKMHTCVAYVPMYVCMHVCMYVCAVHRHRRDYVTGVNNYEDFWGAPNAKLSTQAQTCAGWTTAQFMDLSCPKPKPYL